VTDENATPLGEPIKRTASPRKLASSRANGAKSNGPKTEAGKRRSAQNARKHGLTAVTIVVSNEDQAEFDQLYAAYLDHFQPRNPVEIDLVAEIVSAKWRQRRLWSVESAQLDLEMVRQRPILDQQFEFITEDVRTALAYEEKAKPGDSFFALNRYESRLSRQYHRALRTLLELQSNQPPLRPPQPSENITDQCNPNPNPGHHPDLTVELATSHRSLATQQTDHRPLTTDHCILPNEPNPNSGHGPDPGAELATSHQSLATQQTDHRPLTTDHCVLPNEPNPDSGRRPEANSPRFRIRKTPPGINSHGDYGPSRVLNAFT
jgi:hypothetical protein